MTNVPNTKPQTLMYCIFTYTLGWFGGVNVGIYGNIWHTLMERLGTSAQTLWPGVAAAAWKMDGSKLNSGRRGLGCLSLSKQRPTGW